MKTLELIIEDYKFEVPVFEKDGGKWVALKPICDVLGVQFARQIQRVKGSEAINHIHMYTVATDGKQREMFCIEIDSIGEWIFGINPKKVKPEIQERMYLFRKKLQAVLYAAVTGHSDLNQVATLVEEIKQLRQIVQEQGQLIDYLIQKDALNDKYVDQRLASAGGSLLSSYGHKKRKLTVVK